MPHNVNGNIAKVWNTYFKTLFKELLIDKQLYFVLNSYISKYYINIYKYFISEYLMKLVESI